jgi:endonuclease/exonuclease/phosphatase family metal-dependent hydrolase
MSIIRVMSYNVHAGIGLDDKYDPTRIEEVIRQSEADIVGLQEVDVHWGSRSHNEDMLQRLSDQLGMHTFYAPIYELPPMKAAQPTRQFGVALLTKFRIVEAVNLEMSRLSSQDALPIPKPMPGFAKITLDIIGSPLSVYVVHLDYQTNPSVRITQVEEILSVFQGTPDEKRLLLGDFNARPDAAELAPLFSALQDTWTIRHGDAGSTFPADIPDRKIDYILASPDIRTVSSEVIHSHASDHRPIVADLELPAL